MFLKKMYRGKGEEQQKEFKRKYALRKKECIGFVPYSKVTIGGRRRIIRIRCENEFTTRDPTKVFCSDKCRFNFHQEMKNQDKGIS